MDLQTRCHYSYNWLMYLHFVRQDQDAVKKVYNELPDERRDEQMYKMVQGLSSKLSGNLQEAHSQILEAVHYNTVPQDEGADGDVGSPKSAKSSGSGEDSEAFEDRSNDEQSSTDNILTQYLTTEDIASLALRGQFQAAVAAYNRLYVQYDASSLASLWKLPFFHAFVAERKLIRSNVALSSIAEYDGNTAAAIAAVRSELTTLINGGLCSEDAVYQALARFANPDVFLFRSSSRSLHAPGSITNAVRSRATLLQSQSPENGEPQSAGSTENPADQSVPAPTTKDIIEQALQRHPGNVDLVDTLVRSYLHEDNYDAAFRLLLAHQNAGIQLQHAQNIDLSFVSGLAGDADMSLTRAKLGACQSAYSTAAWNNIGVSLIERRKHVTGIGSMRFSRALDVTNWMALHNMGFVHLKMGLFASATVFLTAAYRYGSVASGRNKCGAATLFLLSVCVRELGNRALARRLMLNAGRLLKNDDVAVVVFLIPALIEAGEYTMAIEVYHKFADMVKYMRGDTIRHQQMRRTELSQQLDYFATHVPDIVQLLTYMQHELLPGSASAAPATKPTNQSSETDDSSNDVDPENDN